MNVDVALCLPHEAETVALIRRIVADALGSLGVTEACVDDIRLALSEACTNVLEHASDEDEYEVRVEIDDHRCAISVRNTGSAFDAEAVSGTMPDGSSPRGRGMAIMRAVMDHVAFASEPETGTIVRLVKSLAVREGGVLARLQEQPRPRA